MGENPEYHELKLPVGQIKGIIRQTIYDDSYYSFEGIPYGQPPVGELRFKAPLPAKAWSDVKDCTDFKIKPIQLSPVTGKAEGSEDCLYLNVFAKTLSSDKPLPVMIWIYGGGFAMGEATRNLYSPDYFMMKDVVVVTFNYRLCSLGFLSVQDPSLQIPGNAALKDQVLALKWVKQYIQYFNGDPNNITLFGDSAGGASTHYMATTEQTKVLFHKAICMSGTMLNPWSNTPPNDHAFRLAKEHGYQGANDDRDVVTYLQSLEAEKLVKHNILTDADRRNGVLFAFGPCIEPYVSEDCIVPKEVNEMLKEAWGNQIPMILSGTADEGLLFYPKLKMFPQSMNALQNDPERVLPGLVRDANAKEKNLELAELIIKTHFGEKVPSEECLKEFIDFYGLKVFWHGTHRGLQARCAYASSVPTYFYRFAFDSPTFNHHRKRFCGTDISNGVAHADDVSYLWYPSFAWKLNRATKEFKTIERMIDIFTTFAKDSNPNCTELSDFVEWLPIEPKEPNLALIISDYLECKAIPEKQKLLVWDSLYDKVPLF